MLNRTRAPLAHSVLAVLCAVVVSGTPARAALAQAVETSLAADVVVPRSYYASTRSAGPLVRAAATLGHPHRRHVRARLELEAAWLIDRGAPSGPKPPERGTIRSVSALASLLIGSTDPSGAPYVFLGLGPQRVAIDGAVPFARSTAVGVRTGLGIRGTLGSTKVFGEVAIHVVASDYGTGADFGAGVYVPVVFGIRF